MNLDDPSGQCAGVIGGITQTPGTPNVAAQTNFANAVGADSAYPYAGGSTLGGLSDVASQGISGGNENTNVAIAEIMDVARTPGPINIFAISGGAQAFATALPYLPTDVRSRINNVTYIMPGSLGATLPRGAGTTTLVDSPGVVNFLIVGNVPYGANQITVHCGVDDHDANCAFQQAGEQLKKLAGGPCSTIRVFRLGADSGGSGWGGQGWNWISLLFLMQIHLMQTQLHESVTHTIYLSDGNVTGLMPY